LVEGRPGAGKTTALCILSQVLRDADIRLCGFLTKELRRVVAALASRKECVVLTNELGKMEWPQQGSTAHDRRGTRP
jgi:hypothetical protein